MAPCTRRRKRILSQHRAGCSHGTVVLGALGWLEEPSDILAQSSGRPAEPRYPFHPPLRDRYSG
jgi:hypothetical protein